MELTVDTYIMGVWFLEHKVGNIMMTVYKDNKDSDEWKGEIRVRAYVDNQVFGSQDKKDFYQRSWPKGYSAENVKKDVDTLMKLYTDAYPPDVKDYIEVNGDGEKMVELLAKASWANMKKLDPDNEEDRRWCEENGIDIERKGDEKQNNNE